MRGTPARLLALAAAILALAWTPAVSAAPVVTDKDALEANLVKRVNAVRKGKGLAPLRVVPRLANAADRHATSMAAAAYFRHELFTPKRDVRWTPFATWVRWFWPGPGYGTWSAGENLAWGAPELTANQTVARWLRSPGHRANLLNPSWRNVGFAAVHVEDPAGYYAEWDGVTIVAAEFGFRRR